MTEPYRKYKVEDLELLEFIRDRFWEKKSENGVRRNNGNIHDEWFLGWPGIALVFGETTFWDNNPGIGEKLQALTYPFNEPIMNCWVKFYNTGEYSCLHTDDAKFIKGPKPYENGWTNSILLDQPSDMEGGDVVLAGDGWEPNFDQIKSRLITLRHNNIGDTITWNNEIVHGVSRIERGYRATLIVVKERKVND